MANSRLKEGESPMSNKPNYWFPAKRYGWGWGVPSSWQGRLVLAGFIVLFGAGFLIFPPNTELGTLLGYVAILTVLLIAICWLKGEPPRWRWGNGEGV
jgi:hypothetical protein